MPYLDKPQVYYENIKDRKYNDIKADIYKRYVQNIESTIYPRERIYPTRK